MIPFLPAKLNNYNAYNVNYFPPHVETLLYRAMDLHGLVLLHGLNYPTHLAQDIKRFHSELSRRIKLKSSPRGWQQSPKQLAVCQLSSSSTTFYSFVISVKALLDVMATVWVRIALPSSERKAFSKRAIGDKVLAGGNLIAWFRNCCPSSFSNAIEASNIIERHSDRWVTELVQYRDNFCHHGGIPNSIPLCVEIDLNNIQEDEKGTYPRIEYQLSETIMPSLPNGQPKGDFIAFAGNQIQILMRQMFYLFCYDQPRCSNGPPISGDRWYIPDPELD